VKYDWKQREDGSWIVIESTNDQRQAWAQIALSSNLDWQWQVVANRHHLDRESTGPVRTMYGSGCMTKMEAIDAAELVLDQVISLALWGPQARLQALADRLSAMPGRR
jgi:hypothetical protein